MSVSKSFSMFSYQLLSVQSSLSIFTQKYPHICEDTYFILQNNYLCIYEDSVGVKILRDDCALTSYVCATCYLHCILGLDFLAFGLDVLVLIDHHSLLKKGRKT